MDLEFIVEGSAFTRYAVLQGENMTEYLDLERSHVQAHAQIARRLQQLAVRVQGCRKRVHDSQG